MTISELARATGISPSAIRFYEQAGLLPPARRVSGRRVFDDDAIPHLTFVQVAKHAGFTLQEIRRLLRDFRSDRWRTLAEQKLTELSALAARVRVMQALLRRLLDCGCFDVQACGDVLRRHRIPRR
jgi:MerR family transcriptional regulator, redox-sensitive transcriptional activator SoxR